MTYRKTWFSYVLWAVYTGVCIFLLAFMGYSIYLHIISSEMTVLGGLMLFPATIGIYFIVKTISYAGRRKWHMHPHTAAMWEAFLLSVLIVFSLLYRVHYLLYGTNTLWNGKLTTIEEAASQSAIYQQAQVGTGMQITGSLQDVLYGKGLSIAFSFLGNKVIAAMGFQLLLQMAALIIGYLVVRKMAGRIPALVTLLVMAVSNSYLLEIGAISAGCFSFVCYLIGLLCVTGYVKSFCRKGFTGGRTVLKAIGLGMVLGFLVYLDLTRAVLLLFLIGIFTGYRILGAAADTKLRKITVSDRILATVLPVVMTVLMCGIMNFAEAFSEKSGFLVHLEGWAVLQLQQAIWNPFYTIDNYGYDMPVQTMTVILAAFLVIEFFRSGKEQNYMLWIITTLCMATTIFEAVSAPAASMISIYCWAVLAGLGLQNCVCERAPELMLAEPEETASSEPEKTTEIVEETTEIAEEQSVEKTQEVSETTESVREAEQVQEPAVQLIENPLPLPKKHVKKEMDFEYPVREDEMKFDIEVDDTDDFDV